MVYTNTKTRAKMMAVLLLIVMVFSTFAPIAQQAGLNIGPSVAVTAYAGPDDEPSTTGGGLDDITIGTDGKVTFGADANIDTGEVLQKGKGIVTIILSACCLICLAFLIINITKFAKSGDNDSERRKAIGGMLTTGIGVALLGSVTFWYAFFYGAVGTIS